MFWSRLTLLWTILCLGQIFASKIGDIVLQSWRNSGCFQICECSILYWKIWKWIINLHHVHSWYNLLVSIFVGSNNLLFFPEARFQRIFQLGHYLTYIGHIHPHECIEIKNLGPWYFRDAITWIYVTMKCGVSEVITVGQNGLMSYFGSSDRWDMMDGMFLHYNISIWGRRDPLCNAWHCYDNNEAHPRTTKS